MLIFPVEKNIPRRDLRTFGKVISQLSRQAGL